MRGKKDKAWGHEQKLMEKHYLCLKRVPKTFKPGIRIPFNRDIREAIV